MSQTGEMFKVGSYMIKSGLKLIAPESSKSVSQQKVSQNDAMARRESQKLKTVLSSIGTVILKVCKGPESVTEKWN